jgi:hypothetical protein
LSIYLEAQRKSNSLAKGNRKKNNRMAEYSRLGSNQLIIILRKLQFLFLFKYLVFSKQKPFSIIFPFSKLVNWHFIQNFGNCQNELGTQIFVFGLPKLQIEQYFFFGKTHKLLPVTMNHIKITGRKKGLLITVITAGKRDMILSRSTDENN